MMYRVDLLIVWFLTPFSTVFHLYHGGQCTYPWFPGVLLTSTSHNIFSKTLAAFTLYGVDALITYWLENGSNLFLSRAVKTLPKNVTALQVFLMHPYR